jgi:hypothetical protein
MVEDNFLDNNLFNELENFVLNNNNFPFFLQKKLNDEQDNENDYYFYHLVIDQGLKTSNSFDFLINFLAKKLDVKSFIRIKINLYPSTENIIEHASHVDYDFSHKGIILSLNTCDGYTTLFDNTKVDSVRNRALFFDPSKPHSSSSCTNSQFRANINMNYL